MPIELAYTLHGRGPSRVVVLHDWLGDRHNWDPVLPYLDTDRFTYAFVDLRGYGGSKAITGEYTAKEAASDVLAVADGLGWDRFAAVGHSMTSVVVQQMAVDAPLRITRLVAVTPVGPSGLRPPAEAVANSERIALVVPAREDALRRMWGDRLSERWLRHKLARWAESADPQAVKGYVKMYAWADLGERAKEVDIPLLVVAGEHEPPWFSAEALRAAFSPYRQLEVVTCGNAGHYPMEETPVALATRMERFLAQGA